MSGCVGGDRGRVSSHNFHKTPESKSPILHFQRRKPGLRLGNLPKVLLLLTGRAGTGTQEVRLPTTRGALTGCARTRPRRGPVQAGGWGHLRQAGQALWPPHSPPEHTQLPACPSLGSAHPGFRGDFVRLRGLRAWTWEVLSKCSLERVVIPLLSHYRAPTLPVTLVCTEQGSRPRKTRPCLGPPCTRRSGRCPLAPVCRTKMPVLSLERREGRAASSQVWVAVPAVTAGQAGWGVAGAGGLSLPPLSSRLRTRHRCPGPLRASRTITRCMCEPPTS